MTVDWNNFSAFEGTLTKATLYDPDALAYPSGDNAIDVQKHVKKFYEWLDIIREDQLRASIFGARSDAAKSILDKFLPQNQYALRVSFKKDTADPTPTGVPVVVGIGTSNEKLHLTDGPSALAYLFAIAIPPSQPVTLQEYIVPLQILLCRSIYLAYIGRIGPNAQFQYDIDSLPQMSCSMYFGDPSKFMLGSTFSAGIKSAAAEDADYYPLQAMLDDWRRDAMNEAIKKADPDANAPALKMGPIELKYWATMLWTKIESTAGVRPKAKVTYQAIKTAFFTVWAAPPPVPPEPANADSIPLTDVYLPATYKEQIVTSLMGILESRFDSDDADNDKLKERFIPFLTSWLTPHVITLPLKDTNGAYRIDQELLLPPTKQPGFELLRDGAIEGFWSTMGTKLLTAVEEINTGRINGSIRFRSTRYGRCAESYCFVCMTHPYWQNATITDTASVQGVAISVRGAGSLNFYDSFTSVVLSGRNVCRLPCENCSAAIPKFGMLGTTYNQAINGLPDVPNELE